jgi:hypothetical protein
MASDPAVADTPIDAGTMLMEKSLLLQGVASGKWPCFPGLPAFSEIHNVALSPAVASTTLLQVSLLLQIYKLLQVVLVFRPPCFS